MKILVGRIHFDTFFAWPCVCVVDIGPSFCGAPFC